MDDAPVELAGSCRYEIEIDMSSNSTHATVVRLVGSGKRVLELGCATGHMSRVLQERGCQIVAIEMDALAADRASAYCERVIIGDLDQMNLDRELGDDLFDVVVAADVLEHLKYPAAALRGVKNFLKPEGYVVVSLPNVAHLSIRLAILAGRFPYAETGLLDRTHLRFFTRESAEKLFDDAGFAIGHFQAMPHVPPDPARFEVPYNPGAFPAPLIETLTSDPEAWTYQFAVLAYPLPHAGLTFLQSRFKQIANELDNIRKHAQDHQRQLEEANRLCELSSAEISELRAQVESLAERSAAAESQAAELQSRNDILTQDSAAHREDAARLHRLKVEAESRLMILQAEVSKTTRRVVELADLKDARDQETAELRKSFEEQKHRLAGMTAQAEILSMREKDLREMLLEAHDQLLRRDDEIAAMLGTSLPPGAAPAKYDIYQQLVQRIRAVVRQSLPEGSKVLVISKGDDQLLRLDSCTGSHFPQREDGVYAGHYPSDDQAAIEHLTNLRKAGGRYLLIPQTSLWWLDHYRALNDYLNQHCTRIVDQPETCLIFDLDTPKSSPARQERARLVDPPKHDFGVNLAAHLRSEKGVGEGARSTVRSLKAVGVPVELNDFTDFSSLNTDTEFSAVSEANPYSINLIHANADCLIEFMQWKSPTYFEGHYNIGFWAWELSKFPKIWSSGFQLLDEVWVPSTFALDSISRASPVPVVAIPHSIRELTIAENRDRKSFGLPSDNFVFLFMFDLMSILQRKNPLGLIEAFKKAFKPRDKTTLVLKLSHSDEYPAERRTLEQAAKGSNVIMVDQILSREDTNSLLNLCDCYVSLHRSEGFGLTMAEAMSLAKPVIATSYSGNMDFMNPLNSFLVNHRLIALDQDYSPYPKNSVWANPDLDHAAELMRSVFTNRKLARDVGLQAQKDVRATLGSAAVGAIIRERFATLAALGKLSVPDEFLNPVKSAKPNEPAPEYRRVIDQVHKLIHSSTAPGTTVMVVSKGDEALVKLDGRQGWHFPRQEDGLYAGYHPSDSAEAIGHLEVLRARGGQFLLIPPTASWWLDHYAEFRQYLDARYRKVQANGSGVLYELTSPGVISAKTKRKVNGAILPDPSSNIRKTRGRRLVAS